VFFHFVFLSFCGLWVGWGWLGEAGGDGAERGGGEGVEGEQQSGFHGFGVPCLFFG
jgi:hypothetical protein